MFVNASGVVNTQVRAVISSSQGISIPIIFKIRGNKIFDFQELKISEKFRAKIGD